MQVKNALKGQMVGKIGRLSRPYTPNLTQVYMITAVMLIYMQKTPFYAHFMHKKIWVCTLQHMLLLMHEMPSYAIFCACIKGKALAAVAVLR